MDIIDPMAGIGDMFIPFLGGKHSLSAVEIDSEAYSLLSKRVPSAVLGNAFSHEQIECYHKGGYDLVITNPPYVRRELIKASASLPHYLSLDEVYHNLFVLAQESLSLNDNERDLFVKTLNRISKLSDLAIPSWLLCMLLTKPNGELALVVPASWLTREYAKPLVSLFHELFDIRFIIKDVNSFLFKGKALVQTNLIVAKRKGSISSSCNNIHIISLYKSFLKTKDCIERLKQEHNLFESTSGYEIQIISQNDFIQPNNSQNTFVKKSSCLSRFFDLSSKETIGLSDLGVICNQGFRSGANTFFYFTKEEGRLMSAYRDSIPSSLINEFFIPAIQNQEDLTGDLAIVSQGHNYILTIRDSVRQSDLPQHSRYKVLPDSISNYIDSSEKRTVKGTRIPELSAVKTNVKPGSKGKEPRFWYMLPPFTPRHMADIFIPRVNSGRTHVYLNIQKSVIDANFVTFSIAGNNHFSTMGLFALLNSTWAAIQFEEVCSVMGGGALKIDSAQLSKLFFPKFTPKELSKLDKLGNELSKQRIDNCDDTIRKIDTIIILALGYKCSPSICQSLYEQNQSYIIRRYGSK